MRVGGPNCIAAFGTSAEYPIMHRLADHTAMVIEELPHAFALR
jgi:hypothetical protein